MGRIRTTRARTAALAGAAATVAATVVGVATAGPAWAPPPQLPGSTVQVDPASGDLLLVGTAVANDIDATRVDDTTVDLVDVKPISPSGGCWYPDLAATTEVRCTVAPDAELRLRPGDGSDRVTLHGDVCGWVVLLGGGDDVVDTLDVGCDGTVAAGSAGDDTLVSGTGADAFDAGAGEDAVTYGGARQPLGPVVVDLAAQGGGTTLAEDHWEEVEAVTGTKLDDTITGDAAPNALDGRRGHDVIAGGGGGDTLYGGSGDDTLDGGAGVDDLDGGSGADVCDVGPDGGTEASCEG